MSARTKWLATVAVAAAGMVLVSLGQAAAQAPPSGGEPRAVQVQRLSLRLAADAGQLANVQGGSKEDGAPVIQWPWAGGDNERWEAEAGLDGYYRFTSVNSGKCLNVQGGGTDDGAAVIQYTCGSAPNELWKFVPQGTGYQVVAKSSGKCLNVKGGVGKGNALIQYTCTAGVANDIWLPVWEPAKS